MWHLTKQLRNAVALFVSGHRLKSLMVDLGVTPRAARSSNIGGSALPEQLRQGHCRLEWINTAAGTCEVRLNCPGERENVGESTVRFWGALKPLRGSREAFLSGIGSERKVQNLVATIKESEPAMTMLGVAQKREVQLGTRRSKRRCVQ